MYHVPSALQCIYGRSDEGGENGEEGREWRLPGLLCADDLALCGESEEGLRAMVGRFVEVCRRRGLKVNGGKSKVMLLGGEEELECEVWVDWVRLEYVSEFKYLGCVLGEPGTDEAECNRKVASERRVAGDIRALVKARVCTLSVLRSCMSHCWCLFLRLVARQ